MVQKKSFPVLRASEMMHKKICSFLSASTRALDGTKEDLSSSKGLCKGLGRVQKKICPVRRASVRASGGYGRRFVQFEGPGTGYEKGEPIRVCTFCPGGREERQSSNCGVFWLLREEVVEDEEQQP
jgi:hypothetical protein